MLRKVVTEDEICDGCFYQLSIHIQMMTAKDKIS